MPYRSIQMLVLAAALCASKGGQLPIVRSAEVSSREELRDAVAMPTPFGEWRRTSQGWQRSSGWESIAGAGEVPPAARIHPAIVASLIALLSLGALIGFDAPSRATR